MSSPETLQDFNPEIDKIWGSFARKTERTSKVEQDVPKEFGLPTGFVTEKGSVYSYNKDGSVRRDKFDGTQHEQGIAVFIDDTEHNLDILTRLGAESSHLPPEIRKKAYIVQVDAEKGVLTKIYNTKEVTDPANLGFALINGNGQVTGLIRASLQPRIGSYVYEMSKLPDGSTSRHPGHRVSDIAL